MPHRSQELVALCFLCKAPATTACERCRRPLCEEHDPGGDIRCHSCEWTFYLSLFPEARKMRRRKAVVAAVSALGFLLTYIAFLKGMPPRGLLVGSLLLWGAGMVWESTEEKRSYARLRRRFLRERKDQMLPGREVKQLVGGPVE